MKSGVMIVNVSRGGLIDEEALVEGLETFRISAAALDVFGEEPLQMDNPLITTERCVLGSHNASNTIEAVNRTSLKSIATLSELLPS